MQKTHRSPIPESDPASAGFDPTRLARIRPWMQGYVDTGRLPGALTLVARRGAIGLTPTFGTLSFAPR